MPETELPHPAFEPSVSARIAEAVLARLRADAALAGYFTSIEDYEVEDLFREGTFTTPVLGVIIDATDERRTGSGRQNTLDTRLVLAMIHTVDNRVGTRRFLRDRVVDRIKTVLTVDGGRMLDEFERPLTEALLVFQRVLPPIRIAGAAVYVVTRLGVTWTTNLHEATREIL